MSYKFIICLNNHKNFLHLRHKDLNDIKKDGKNGVGKSITLCHVLHYAFLQKYIIVHVAWGMVQLNINATYIL